MYKYLCENKREYVLSKQLLRSGNLIGANIEEALGSQLEVEFASKISIPYKDSRGTHYWIRLLRDSDYLNRPETDSILNDCDVLCKILGSIVRAYYNRTKD